MGPHSSALGKPGDRAYTLPPYLSYDLCPLAINLRNIRYHTLRYRGVYAPNLPLIHSASGIGAGLCYRDFPRMSDTGSLVSEKNPSR